MKLLVDQFLLHLKAQRNFARNTIKAYQFDLSEFNAYTAANKAASPKDLDRLLMRYIDPGHKVVPYKPKTETGPLAPRGSLAASKLKDPNPAERSKG